MYIIHSTVHRNCLQTQVIGHWVAGWHNGCKLSHTLPLCDSCEPCHPATILLLSYHCHHATSLLTPSARISFTKALLYGFLVQLMNLPWSQNPIVLPPAPALPKPSTQPWIKRQDQFHCGLPCCVFCICMLYNWIHTAIFAKTDICF